MNKIPEKKLGSKGAVSIIIVMSILVAVLAIALGTSSVATTDLRSSLGSSESTTAFFAAETGIEKAMFTIKGGSDPVTGCYTWTTVGTAKYCLLVTGTLAGGDLVVESIGDFKSTRRSIQLSF